MSSTNELNTALADTFTLWYHSSTNQDWSLESYNEIFNFNTVDELLTLVKTALAHKKLITYGMFFIMRQGVKPIWEDPENSAGGCVTWKIEKDEIGDCWENICLMLASDGFSSLREYGINGISISPKKNNNILKLWLKTAPSSPISVDMLPDYCIFRNKSMLFKPHSSE
jgi:hypothetical protein